MATDQERVPVAEFHNGCAVTEVWRSSSQDGQRLFFDVRCTRDYMVGVEAKRGPFLQQRDVPDMVLSLISAQSYIEELHPEPYRGSKDRFETRLLLTEEEVADYSERAKVAEFQSGCSVAEVWESRSKDGIKVFFDVRCNRAFAISGEMKRGPYLQQKDIPDMIISLMQSLKFITERHTEIRRTRRGGEFDSDSGSFGDEGRLVGEG
jgi:hypothetical protein